MLNWAQTLMQGAGAAGVAFIGADYLVPVLLPPQWRSPHASLALLHHHADPVDLQLTAASARARLQNLLSLLKIAMIVGLAPSHCCSRPAQWRMPPSVAAAPTGLRLASALSPVYAYGGYQLTMNLGADLKDARGVFLWRSPPAC